jgi:IclR family transcriptional regulator, KDG regulon repressor
MEKYQEAGTQALQRAIFILNSFSQGRIELSLTDFCKNLSLPKGTVHRLLSTLKYHHFIEQDQTNLKYRLGWRLFELGSSVDTLNLLTKNAHPFLEELCERCKETVHLAVLKEGDIFYIDKIIGEHKMTMVTSVGLRLPSHVGGLGKCLLAFLSDEELDKILGGRELKRFTKNTLTDPGKLKEALKKVRENGYALDNEEVEIGLTCVAVPVKDFSGKVVAAVSISGPTLRINKDIRSHYIKLLLDTGQKVSEALGLKAHSDGGL